MRKSCTPVGRKPNPYMRQRFDQLTKEDKKGVNKHMKGSTFSNYQENAK